MDGGPRVMARIARTHAAALVSGWCAASLCSATLRAQAVTVGGGLEVGGAVLQQPSLRASGAGYAGLTGSARVYRTDASLTAFGASGLAGWASSQLAATLASPQVLGMRVHASGARFGATGLDVFSHADVGLGAVRDVREFTLGARGGIGRLRYRGASGGDWFAAGSITRWQFPLAISLDATVSAGLRPVDLIEPLRALPPIQIQNSPTPLPSPSDTFGIVSLAPPQQYRYGVADVAVRAAYKRGAWRSEVELFTRPWLDNVSGQRVASSVSLAWTPTTQATFVLSAGERLPNVREGIPAGRWLTLGVRMEPRRWSPRRARGRAPLAGPTLQVERRTLMLRGVDSEATGSVVLRGDFTEWHARQCLPVAGERGTVDCGPAPGVGAWRVAVRIGADVRWRPPVNLPASADDFGAEDGLLLIGR
jgi:hypothetical protein